MLFKEIPTSQEAKKKNRIKRPERNRKELTDRAQIRDDRAPVSEDLTRDDVLDLMGVRDRGLKRRRGAWRKV